MMLGPSLLVATVVEPGATIRTLYLPRGAHWTDWWTEETFEGGTTVTRDAPPDKPVMFARAGNRIPMNIAEQHFAKPAYELAVRLFPPVGEEVVEAEVFENEEDSESGGHSLPRAAHIPSLIP